MEPRYVRIVVPEPSYTLFRTGTKELPEVVYVNGSLRDFPHRNIFPWHLRVVIEAAEVDAEGMPTPGEFNVLFKVGESIRRAVEGDEALPVSGSTWNGQRELVFRVHDAEWVNAVLQRHLKIDDRRPWEYRMEHDPDWELAAPEFRLFETATSSESGPDGGKPTRDA